jgi:hypothetical protein
MIDAAWCHLLSFCALLAASPRPLLLRTKWLRGFMPSWLRNSNTVRARWCPPNARGDAIFLQVSRLRNTITDNQSSWNWTAGPSWHLLCCSGPQRGGRTVRGAMVVICGQVYVRLKLYMAKIVCHPVVCAGGESAWVHAQRRRRSGRCILNAWKTCEA